MLKKLALAGVAVASVAAPMAASGVANASAPASPTASTASSATSAVGPATAASSARACSFNFSWSLKHGLDIPAWYSRPWGVPGGTTSVYCWPSLSADAHVRDMQQDLRWALSRLAPGSAGTRIAVDGVWGPATRSATIQFQRAMKLSADGSWGPETNLRMAQYVNSH